MKIIGLRNASGNMLYLSVYTIGISKLQPDNIEKNEFYQWENVPENVILKPIKK